MSNVRNTRYDVLRVFAIVLIVIMHSPRPDGGAPGYVLASLSYVTAPGLVLFFMLSGALLLDNKLSTSEFLKRRFSKVLWPTAFWTVVYMLVKWFTEPYAMDALFRTVLSMPFSAQGHGILWFMYTLAGLYLLTPILAKWLRASSKREIEFYLALWCITLSYPYLCQVLDINQSRSGILYYFTGYVGYFVLGHYLKKYYIYRVLHVFIAIGIAVIIPVILYSSGIEFDFYSMLWYLSLPVAMMAFALFVLFSRLPEKHSSLLKSASKLSFGVYFVHILIMRQFVWRIDLVCMMPSILQIVTIVLLTLLLSYLCSWLLSRLPCSKYIIGV